MTNFLMLLKISRPCATASAIEVNESFFSIILAVSFATCVPRNPIAIPTSAFFKAGASFTPSPVIATILPAFWKISAISNFCFGVVRANTAVDRILFFQSLVSDFISGKSIPVITFPSSSSTKPTFFAIFKAVLGWSPVIITTLIPASRQVIIAFRISNRGGSIKPIEPI